MESYYKRRNKVKNKKKVMKALEEQRGKYDETFELWNAKQRELELKRQDAAAERVRKRKVDPNRTRKPNKTDLYERF